MLIYLCSLTRVAAVAAVVYIKKTVSSSVISFLTAAATTTGNFGLTNFTMAFYFVVFIPNMADR